MLETNQAATVLVTGAGRRLGRAMALDLAGSGWRVAVHFHASHNEAAALVAEIEDAGGVAIAREADLADPAAIDALIGACADALGPVTCLINNAACFEWDTLQTLNYDVWNAHLDINLRAPVFLTRAFAAALPQDCDGNVINIVDQKLLLLNQDFFSYTIAKAALWSATEMMAQALAPRIRVNAIGPGPVFQSYRQSRADFDAECAATLLGRGVAPEDICAAVRFLIENPAVTGQMIAVDSGQHLVRAPVEPERRKPH